MNHHCLFIFFLVLGVVGCASTREVNYENQVENDTTDAIVYLVNSINDANQPIAIPEQSVNYLTDLVNVPELEKYIDEALQKNPSLQQSVIALHIAYANQDIEGANLLPFMTSSFSGEKIQDMDDFFSAELTVSWELDLWRQLADTNNAAKVDILSTQAGLQTAKNLVVANLMRGWLAISADKQQQHRRKRQLLATKKGSNKISVVCYC